MSLKPIKIKPQAGVLPEKKLLETLRQKRKYFSKNTPLRQTMRRLIWYRPWLLSSEIARQVGVSRTDVVKKAYKELYGMPYRKVKKQWSEWKKWWPYKKKILAVKNSLREISPNYRRDYLSKNDFLSPHLTPGIRLPVPMTEVSDDPKIRRRVDMPYKLGEILEYNLNKAAIRDLYFRKKGEISAMQMLDLGVSEKRIMSKLGIKKRELAEIKKKYEELKAEGVDFRKLKPILSEDEKEERIKLAKKIYESLPKELKQADLCPAYATNNKAERGIQRMFAYNGLKGKSKFSRPVLNIPFLEYMPPKRVQIASHSIAKNRENIEMLYGEEPVVKASLVNRIGFDDLSGKGINVYLRFPRSKEEWMKTYGGGIVITEAMAKKGTYRFKSPEKVAYSASPDGFVPEGTKVEKGDLVVKKKIPNLGIGRNVYVSNYSGVVRWLGPPVPHTKDGKVLYYTRKYYIERVSPLTVGTKLMSRTGIKGVVTDIIPGDKPMMIVNFDDVWTDIPESLRKKYEKAIAKPPERRTIDDENIIREYQRKLNKRKAALFKELDAGGGQIFVFLEPSGFPEDYEAHGLRLSWTFLSGALEKEKFDTLFNKYYGYNEEIARLLKFLHLKLEKTEDGKYKIVVDDKEPEPDDGGKIIKFRHKVAINSPHEKEFETLYVPNFMEKYFIDQDGYVRSFGIREGMKEQEKIKAYHAMRKHALKLLNDLLFSPRFATAMDLKVVAANIKPDQVLVDKKLADILGLKEGMWVGVRKEPVTSADSIMTLRVKIDKSGKYRNVLGLHPLIAKQATIDFDGDSASLFYPPISKKFVPKLSVDSRKEIEEWKKKGWSSTVTSEEVESCRVDEDTLAEMCRQYNLETRKVDNKDIMQFGLARKRALILAPAILKDNNITLKDVNRVFNVERVMKARVTLEDIAEEKKFRKMIMQYKKKKQHPLMQILVSKSLKSDKQLIGAVLDPKDFYIDRIVVGQILPKDQIRDLIPQQLPRKEIEIKNQIQEVKTVMERLELLKKSAFSDFERMSIDAQIRKLQKQLKALKKKLSNIEKEKRKKIVLR